MPTPMAAPESVVGIFLRCIDAVDVEGSCVTTAEVVAVETGAITFFFLGARAAFLSAAYLAS